MLDQCKKGQTDGTFLINLLTVNKDKGKTWCEYASREIFTISKNTYSVLLKDGPTRRHTHKNKRNPRVFI